VRGGRLRGLVHRRYEGMIVPLLRQWVAGTLPPPRPLVGGRGGAGCLTVAADLEVVVRPYRRGGWMGKINRRLYFGLRLRPIRELQVAVELRSRGVPTVEPIAAAVCWLLPGCYRGVFLSRHLPLAVNLWQYLRAADPGDRERVCRDAAVATRCLHDAGGVHPDLNLENFLVHRGASGREVLIIDFDRVRIGAVTAHDRRSAFARLCRSMRKLDPTAEIITLGCIEAFRTIVDPRS
jgi:Lipopolysaccharide kinase (Kdo/WaaP) family